MLWLFHDFQEFAGTILIYTMHCGKLCYGTLIGLHKSIELLMKRFGIFILETSQLRYQIRSRSPTMAAWVSASPWPARRDPKLGPCALIAVGTLPRVTIRPPGRP